MFNLKEMQKKGSISMDGTTKKLVGVMVVLILIGAFAPTIFENANLSGTGAPSWLITVAPILIAVVILFVILKLK